MLNYMKQRALRFGAVIAVAMGIAAAGAATWHFDDGLSNSVQVAQAAAPNPTAAPVPRGQVSPPHSVGGASRSAPVPGIPAVRPSSPSTDPNVPSFSVQDVRDYVASRGFVSARIDIASPPVVERVEFMRANAVPAALGGAVEAGDRLVCVVTLRGTFAFSGGTPFVGATRPSPTPPPANTVHLYLDAHTGNQLGIHMTTT